MQGKNEEWADAARLPLNARLQLRIPVTESKFRLRLKVALGSRVAMIG